MSEYRELVEISENEWAALRGGVLVGLVIHPEEADVRVGDVVDVWCDAHSLCLRMSCIVTEQGEAGLFILRSCSAVMEVA